MSKETWSAADQSLREGHQLSDSALEAVLESRQTVGSNGYDGFAIALAIAD